MDPAPNPRDELQELLAQLAAGQISAAGIARIDALVCGDLQLRRLYIEQMRLVADLEFAYGPERLNPPAAVPLLPADAAQSSAGPPSPEAQAVKSPVLGFLSGVVDYVSHSRRMMFLLVAAMLSGWFIFQVGSVLIGRWFAGNGQIAEPAVRPGAAPQGQKPVEGLAAVPGESVEAVAWLSGSVSGRWQFASPRLRTGKLEEPEYWPIGTKLPVGQDINLTAGLVEITFRSGAKVVLTAPVKFSIKSPIGAKLELGKLAAAVPHEAKGFTINTPAGSVVDLGTEFGVEVTPDHKLDVQVFVGEVKVGTSSNGVDGADSAEMHVSAGHTLHVVPGEPATIVESQASRFHRDLAMSEANSPNLDAEYVDFVRRLKPVVWLRMNGKLNDNKLHDEMGNAPDGMVHWDGPGNPWVDGRMEKALWLRGPKLKDYAVVPDYPKAEHGKLSVAAWVYADSRPPFATLLSNGVAVQGHGQFHLGLMSSEVVKKATGERHFRDGEDMSVQIDQANGERVLVAEGDGHSFPLNAWQHVAFVADGAMLRLYRQGKEVASAKYDGLAYPVTFKPLSVGVTTDESDNPVPDAGYWSGKIDEVAIFNDALTPDDVKKLAAAPPH